MNSVADQAVQQVVTELPKSVQSPVKASPLKQPSPTKHDESKQESPQKKMRKFELSLTKVNQEEKAKISIDNLKYFEMIMTNSFGLNSSLDIYPQYEVTPLEKSIGITDRFFGKRPKYFNIMNKTFKR